MDHRWIQAVQSTLLNLVANQVNQPKLIDETIYLITRTTHQVEGAVNTSTYCSATMPTTICETVSIAGDAKVAHASAVCSKYDSGLYINEKHITNDFKLKLLEVP